MKKAVMYVRVSSKGQEKEGFSIPAQIELLRDYGKKCDIKIVKDFIEVETAKKAGRTNFNAMLEYLKKHKDVNTILVEKTDRLYRNFNDYVLLEDTYEIHLVKEGVILSENSRSQEKLMHGFKVLIAKNFIDNLKEETAKGMLEKAEEGGYPHRAPFGYSNIEAPNGKKAIGINLKKAPIVKRMFELYATGSYSLNTLSQKLFDEGFAYSMNKPMPKSQVEFILKNEFYTGVFEWKGKRYENAQHEAIISKELFYKVRDKLIDPRKSKSKYRNFAYTNMVKCAVCGCYLTADIKKGKYVYYYCTQNKGKHAKKYIKQEVLEEQFANVFRDINLSDEQISAIIKGLKELHKQKNIYEGLSLENIQTRISKLQQLMDKCYEDKLEDKINDELWQTKNKAWQEEKDLLIIKLDALNKANKNYLINATTILELCKDAYSKFLSQTPEGKRKLLNLVCSNFSFDNEKIGVELVSPFKEILEANQQKTTDTLDVASITADEIEKQEIKKLPRLDSNQQPTG